MRKLEFDLLASLSVKIDQHLSYGSASVEDRQANSRVHKGLLHFLKLLPALQRLLLEGYGEKLLDLHVYLVRHLPFYLSPDLFLDPHPNGNRK